jgi:hypothetical protein
VTLVSSRDEEEQGEGCEVYTSIEVRRLVPRAWLCDGPGWECVCNDRWPL